MRTPFVSLAMIMDHGSSRVDVRNTVQRLQRIQKVTRNSSTPGNGTVQPCTVL